jgi:hypothetical protein
MQMPLPLHFLPLTTGHELGTQLEPDRDVPVGHVQALPTMVMAVFVQRHCPLVYVEPEGQHWPLTGALPVFVHLQTPLFQAAPETVHVGHEPDVGGVVLEPSHTQLPDDSC